MAKPRKRDPRRTDSLSRERIVEASIELLDSAGEEGLTFRALAEHLSTGAGAIYWHVANKSDLLTAACDDVVAHAVKQAPITTPEESIRTVALALFDLIDERPWVGSTLTGTSGFSPIVHILERIGQQVRNMGVPRQQEWAAAGALMAYILGVSRQNAANRQLAQTQNLERTTFLDTVSAAWAQLDPREYPFTQGLAERVRNHDDREDFLAGLDLILKGIDTLRSSPRARRPRAR